MATLPRTPQEKEHAKEQIQELAPKGSTIYVVLRARNASGMSRTLSLYVIHEGRMAFLDGYVSTVLDIARKGMGKTEEGLYVQGCGMDMGWDVVMRLSSKVWGEENYYQCEWL